jgi:hypothetical protein
MIHGILAIAAGVALLSTLVLAATKGHPDRFMDATYRFRPGEVDEQVMRQHDGRVRRIQVVVIVSFLIATLPVFLLRSK